MNRKTAMLAGAAATVVAASLSMPSVANPIPPAASYADLLVAVPDAQTRLLIADEAERNRPARLIPVQYGYGYGDPYEHHHHHHHHHDHGRRWYEQNGYYWDGYGWARRPIYHHHHHHHHHDWY